MSYSKLLRSRIANWVRTSSFRNPIISLLLFSRLDLLAGVVSGDLGVDPGACHPAILAIHLVPMV